MAFDDIAKIAWTTACRAMNNHRSSVRTALMEILIEPRKAADVIANKIAERVFGNKTTAPIWNLKTDRFQALGINVAKGRTVKNILQDEFPPLDRDGGKADKLVSFRTMAYVQANIILGAMLQVQCYI